MDSPISPASVPFPLPDLPPLARAHDIMLLVPVGSRAGLRKLIEAGGFPKPMLIGRRSQAWRRADLEAWWETLAPAPAPRAAAAGA